MAKSKQEEMCALGVENHTRLEDHDRRITLLEKCKTSSKNSSSGSQNSMGTMQLVLVLLTIAGAVSGTSAWLGKDIDTVARQHASDITSITALSKERVDSFASKYVADHERTLARLTKLEEHNIKEIERLYKEKEELRMQLDELLRDTAQKGL